MTVNEQQNQGNRMMVLEVGAGWNRGIKNMLRGELMHWFNTRTWWVQILIWAASINMVFLAVSLTLKGAVATGEATPLDSIMIFNVFMGLAGAIGVSIVMQNAVVGEKRSGTAAWVLSKPISRIAFILSKLLSNSTGIIVTMILAQGAIAYLIQGFIVGKWLPVGGFLAGLGVHFVHILFYLTLTLMLGAIFDQPAPVIGIPLAFLFSQNFLPSIYPPLSKVMPWILSIPQNNSNELPLAGALMVGAATPSYLPLFTTLGASILFVIIALWVFQRQEL